MSALRSLLATFDVNTGQAVSKLKELGSSITQASSGLSTLAGAMVGAFSVQAFAGFIEGQIELGSRINDTAEKLGVSTEALQKFQYAAGLSGVSAEGSAKALQFLNKNLGEAIGGASESAQVFSSLGIDLASVKDGSKSAADLLPALADKFASAGSDAERTALSMKLFGRSGAEMLPLLKKGGAELANLSQEFIALGGGLDDEFITSADAAGDEIDRLKFAFGGLKFRIAKDVLPGLTDLVKGLQKGVVWFQGMAKDTNIVKESLAALGVVGVAAGAKAFVQWSKVFGLFPKGKAGLAANVIGMGKMGLAIGALGGAGLLLEDLWTGINGGESVIGDFLEKANGVENTKELFANLKGTVEQLGASFETLKAPLGELLKSMSDLAVSPEFIAAIEFCVRLMGSFVRLSLGAVQAVGKMLTGDWKGAGKAVDAAGDAVFGKKGFFGDDAMQPYAKKLPKPNDAYVGPSYQNPASPDYWDPARDPGGAGGITQNNNVQLSVTVNGGATNAETAKAVANATRNTFQDVQNNANAALKRGK